jgi:hypothetical protein
VLNFPEAAAVLPHLASGAPHDFQVVVACAAAMAPSMMVLVPATALQHAAAEPLALGGLKQQQQQADEELETEPPASGGQQQQADEELEAEPPASGGQQQQADEELEAEQPASGGQQQQAAAAAELVTMVSHIADCD